MASSSSCQKCVRVLRELISGLQEPTSATGIGNKNNNSNHHSLPAPVIYNESPPLTLLKAIAWGQQQQQTQQRHQQELATNEKTGPNNTRQQHQLHPTMIVEDVEDGIRLTIPVETTMPTLLRRWTRLTQYHHLGGGRVAADDSRRSTKDEIGTHDDDGDDDLIPLALATSATRHDDDNTNDATTTTTARNNKVVADPLIVELKCRKCASTGPEGGARAFLMGPQPLSVVLCHNRISSQKQEIEEILTHELVHLYDVQTMQLDLQDCENLAYSEVRAAKAAECRDSWKQLQPFCVKQKAICATNNLFPTEGRKCIQRVFDTAFADNRPFDGRTPNP